GQIAAGLDNERKLLPMLIEALRQPSANCPFTGGYLEQQPDRQEMLDEWARDPRLATGVLTLMQGDEITPRYVERLQTMVASGGLTANWPASLFLSYSSAPAAARQLLWPLLQKAPDAWLKLISPLAAGRPTAENLDELESI